MLKGLKKKGNPDYMPIRYVNRRGKPTTKYVKKTDPRAQEFLKREAWENRQGQPHFASTKEAGAPKTIEDSLSMSGLKPVSHNSSFGGRNNQSAWQTPHYTYTNFEEGHFGSMSADIQGKGKMRHKIKARLSERMENMEDFGKALMKLKWHPGKLGRSSKVLEQNAVRTVDEHGTLRIDTNYTAGNGKYKINMEIPGDPTSATVPYVDIQSEDGLGFSGGIGAGGKPYFMYRPRPLPPGVELFSKEHKEFMKREKAESDFFYKEVYPMMQKICDSREGEHWGSERSFW